MSATRESRANNEAASRATRETQDRTVTENREFTDAQRLEMFRMQNFQESLPKLPVIPGYHTCWLTTTNPRDSIHSRIRIGYTLIKSSELPGWDHSAVKTGDYAGCIGVNEMIAAKLPNKLYQAYMAEAFHNQPLAEEGKLSGVLDAMKDEAESRGVRQTHIEAAQGTANLGKKAPKAPSFLDNDSRINIRPPLIPQGVDPDDVVEVTED